MSRFIELTNVRTGAAGLINVDQILVVTPGEDPEEGAVVVLSGGYSFGVEELYDDLKAELMGVLQ